MQSDWQIIQLQSNATTPQGRFVDYFTLIYDMMCEQLDTDDVSDRAVCEYVASMLRGRLDD